MTGVSRLLAEDFQADVAAHLGPFVVLFGEDGTDETDQGLPVGEDADDIGAAPNLPVQPFLVGSAWGAVSVLRPIRFPEAAHRTGRARSRASGSPRVHADGVGLGCGC